jgi:hypothetical protein
VESTQWHFDEEICCDLKDPRACGVVAGCGVVLEIVGDEAQECGDPWDFVSRIDVEEVANEDGLSDLVGDDVIGEKANGDEIWIGEGVEVCLLLVVSVTVEEP